jgi:hypothetical protein
MDIHSGRERFRLYVVFTRSLASQHLNAAIWAFVVTVVSEFVV